MLVASSMLSVDRELEEAGDTGEIGTEVSIGLFDGLNGDTLATKS